jgi:hypothetical protein
MTPGTVMIWTETEEMMMMTWAMLLLRLGRE